MSASGHRRRRARLNVNGRYGTIQRVDRPSDNLLALSLYAPSNKCVLLLAINSGPVRVGLSVKRPKGRSADGVTTALRHHLVGLTVRDVHLGDKGSVRIALSRHRSTDRQTTTDSSMEGWLVAGQRPRGGYLILLDSHDRLKRCAIGRSAIRPHDRIGEAWSNTESWCPASPDELRIRGPRLLEQSEEATEHRAFRELRRDLKRHLKKLARKRKAISGDIQRADASGQWRHHADLILSNLHRIGDGTSPIEVTDWSTDPPALVPLVVDRRLGPQRQAEALYRRAKRAERGARIARPRRESVDEEIRLGLEILRDLDHALEENHSADNRPLAAQQIAQRANIFLDAQPQRQPRGKSEKKNPTRVPYREFNTAEGRILVGKSARDNDELIINYARPHDIWLHARGRQGAHVIVPMTRGTSCHPRLLADAAMLAAHFSRGSKDATMEVQYTERRYVRKKRRAPPGAVLLDREKVFTVRVSDSAVRRLLGSERRA